MVLNLLRVEEINPEYMLERSFYQFQNYAAIPDLCDSKLLSMIRVVSLDYWMTSLVALVKSVRPSEVGCGTYPQAGTYPSL